MKLSNIISMPIISIYESEYYGIVYNVLIDNKQKKIKYLCILNEKDNIHRVVNVDNIFKIGNDCIFVKNQESITLQSNYEQQLNTYFNPINLLAYDFDGKYLGIVNDAICENSKLIEIIINNKNYKINDIINIGTNAILVNNKKIDIKKFKPKQKINICNIEEKVIALSPPHNEKTENNTKIITDFRFLIGRRLKKDIFAINGELIAKKDTTITKDTITKASFYGKLVEIARYSIINEKVM